MHGPLGAAAARLVVEESSRDRESVKGLSLVENLAPVKRENRSVAMRRDALVSDFNAVNKTTLQYNSITKEITHPHPYPCNFIEPHEICPEQNTGDVVWKKTPAGDLAAIACPTDASGTVTERTATCFVCFPWSCLTVYHPPSCQLQVCTFSH